MCWFSLSLTDYDCKRQLTDNQDAFLLDILAGDPDGHLPDAGDAPVHLSAGPGPWLWAGSWCWLLAALHTGQGWTRGLCPMSGLSCAQDQAPATRSPSVRT